MIIDNGIDNGFLEIAQHLGCNPYTHLTVDATQRHLAMKMIEANEALNIESKIEDVTQLS